MADTAAAQPEAAAKPQDSGASAAATSDNKTEGASSDKRDLRNRNWREVADEDSKRDSRRRSRSPGRGERRYRDRSRDDRDRSRDRRGGRGGRGGRGRGGRGGRGNSRGRGGRGGNRHSGNDRDHKAPKPNARFENLPESDDHDEIRKQVEFYFSDANLPQDKFLLLQVEGHKNNAVEIKTIHSFSRMRRFQPYSAVVAALKDSKVLEVIDDTKIRRRVPLSEDISLDPTVNVSRVEDRALPRSIYVKGFGDERDHLQIDIESLFEPYGPILQVRMRRDKIDGHFKGSVFIEFVDETVKDNFMQLEAKPQFEGKDLKYMSKADYVNEKARLIGEGKIRPHSPGAKSKKGRPGRASDGQQNNDSSEQRDQNQSSSADVKDDAGEASNEADKNGESSTVGENGQASEAGNGEAPKENGAQASTEENKA